MPIPTLPQKPDLPVPPAPTPPPRCKVGLVAAEALAWQFQALTQQLAGLREQRRVLQGLIGSPEPQVAATARVPAGASRDRYRPRERRSRWVFGASWPGRWPNPSRGRPSTFLRTLVGDRHGIRRVDCHLHHVHPRGADADFDRAHTRRMLRRSPKETSLSPGDMITPRLDRLEQAVDAIAIEIERIAEGQRFVTKVMADRAAPPPARTAPAAAEAAPQRSARPSHSWRWAPARSNRSERQSDRRSAVDHTALSPEVRKWNKKAAATNVAAAFLVSSV